MESFTKPQDFWDTSIIFPSVCIFWAKAVWLSNNIVRENVCPGAFLLIIYNQDERIDFMRLRLIKVAIVVFIILSVIPREVYAI